MTKTAGASLQRRLELGLAAVDEPAETVQASIGSSSSVAAGPTGRTIGGAVA